MPLRVAEENRETYNFGNTNLFRSFPAIVLSIAVLTIPLNAGEPNGSNDSERRIRVGVDANYSLDMERNGSRWKFGDEASDLFQSMAKQGVTDFRVRLWTKREGPHGRDYATEVVKRSMRAGLNPYLVIFLSDDWSDLMKQPVPDAWKSLSFKERCSAVRDYSKDVVKHFREVGLTNHLYEIGNEVDYGICGEYPSKSGKKTSEALKRKVWLNSASLIKASQQGVLASDPDARFMLHISHWWDSEFCIEFFQFMLEQGVRVDYAGLSYFPSSNIGGSRDMQEFGRCVSKISAAIDRKVIVAETAYPCTRDFKGQFSRWKYEVMGYPMTDAGQQRWLQDFFSYCNAHSDIEAVYYWSPEWYGEGMWKGFALFDIEGKNRPAWKAFASETWNDNSTRNAVFLEVSEDRLFVVPVEDAKRLYIEEIGGLLKQTGGVGVEHIRLLEKSHPTTHGYTIHLKASLQQNLSLSLEDKESGVQVMQEGMLVAERLKLIESRLNPDRDRVILIVREHGSLVVDEVARHFRNQGFPLDVHEFPADRPVVFGMSDVQIAR